MVHDHDRATYLRHVQNILDAKGVWDRLLRSPVGAHVYEERKRVVIDIVRKDDERGHVRVVYKSDPVSVARYTYTFTLSSSTGQGTLI